MPAALRNPKQLPVKALPLFIGDVCRNYPAVTLDKTEIPIRNIDRFQFPRRPPFAGRAGMVFSVIRSKASSTSRNA